MTRDGNHDTCIPRRYSLYVVDNYHLEELWRNIKQVSILNGRAYFHLNAHLCHEKIMLVEEQLKVTATMPTTDRLLTITDASQNSNGERAICKFYFILQYFNVVRCVVLCIEYSVLCIVYCVLCVVYCCVVSYFQAISLTMMDARCIHIKACQCVCVCVYIVLVLVCLVFYYRWERCTCIKCHRWGF